MAKMATHHVIPTNILQATINYLMQRPWNEVNQLLAAIQAQSKVYDQPPLPEPVAAEEDAGQGHA